MRLQNLTSTLREKRTLPYSGWGMSIRYFHNFDVLPGGVADGAPKNSPKCRKELSGSDFYD
jgi:hypothetical protein